MKLINNLIIYIYIAFGGGSWRLRRNTKQSKAVSAKNYLDVTTDGLLRTWHVYPREWEDL